MRTATQVVFDQPERRILTEAVLGVEAAFPDVDRESDPNPIKRVRGIAQKNEAVSRKRLMEAREIIDTAGDVLREQRAASYWLDQLPEAERENGAVISGRNMAMVLSEARQQQYVAVAAAVDVIEAALEVAEDPPDEE